MLREWPVCGIRSTPAQLFKGHYTDSLITIAHALFDSRGWCCAGLWQRSYGNRRHSVGRVSSVDGIVSIAQSSPESVLNEQATLPLLVTGRQSGLHDLHT